MAKSPALAKLTRPRTHQAVARERLFAQVDSARECPLVWIDSPPGSGKTTLVATYLATRGGGEAWYQVDAGDSDPATFFHYLSFVCGKRSNARLPQLAPEHLNDLPAFGRRFFRHLFTHVRLLVLDNFQESADPLLNDLLCHAAQEVPPQGNILVISRTRPPAAFAELEARGLLARIDWTEVQLTLAETRAMCAMRGMGEDRVVQALHQQASGWAAGVTLMLERFRRGESGAGQLSGETRESVFNYFTSLVFDQADDTTQRTLLSLAFFPRMTAALAVAASENMDAGKLLESLHRRQLFTDRRPGSAPVYQFHALFQEFLQMKLLHGPRIQSRPALQHRSARLLIEHGDWEPAFELLVEAGAWKDARSLLLDHAQAFMDSGRWQTLVRWVESLPQRDREEAPWLQYWRARALAQIEPAAAVPAFSNARAAFERYGDRLGRMLATAGLLHVSSVDHVDYAPVEQYLDSLAEDVVTTPFLTPEQELSVLAALAWSAFFVAPWHPCIAPALSRIHALLGEVPAAPVRLAAAISALTVASQSAQMQRSRQLREMVQQLAASDEVSPLLSCWGQFQVAHSFFLDAEYRAAIDVFDRIWSLAQTHDLREVLTAALMHRFMIDFRLSDLRIAEATLQRIEALLAPTSDYSRSVLVCYRGRVAQLRGDLSTGAEFARESQHLMVRTGSLYHEFLFGLINAEMLLHAGLLQDALLLLGRSREILQRCPVLQSLNAAIVIVEAWAAEKNGQGRDSRILLRRALEETRAGFAWCHMRFVDTTLAHMLPIALEENIEADQAGWLIRTFYLRPPSPGIEQWPWPLRIRCLGDFRVEVYELPLEVGRKTPRKVLALLKALVALGPREVPEQQILDALWPDEDGDAAHKALSITVLRLRRLLGDNEFIRQQGGRLSIETRHCWVDAWAFERRLNAPAAASAADIMHTERTLTLYQGAFLPDDSDATFAVAPRERLRAKFVHALEKLGRRLESDGRHDDAIGWYLRGLEADAVIEPFHQGLMRCYAALDRRTEAIATYRRLRQTLSAMLGLQPSATTERLYQSLR